MNRTLRLTLSEAPGSLVLKQALPWVAKYPSIPAPIDRGASEAAFYQAVAATPVVGGRMPALLGVDPSAHLLLLEDLGSAADLTRWYHAAEPDQVAQEAAALSGWLSALHAIDTPPALYNRAMRELNHEHLFVVPFSAGNGLDLGPLGERAPEDRALRHGGAPRARPG